jgi:Fe-S oxidoreductase
MPASSHKTAAIGSSLGAIVLASELSRKGHKVTFYLTGPFGGSLLAAFDRLPSEAVSEALDLLTSLGNKFEEAGDLSPAFLAELLEDYKAVFVDLGDPTLDPAALGLTPAELVPDPITLSSTRDRVFLAPPMDVPFAFLAAARAGKAATVSLDRFFQGAQLSAAREKEAVFDTTLVVDLKEAEPAPPVVFANPLEPTLEEAQAEAGRCLNCACQSCLNVCPHLRHYKGYPKKYAREMYNNIITAYGIRTSNILINSCLECDLCKEICPNGADVAAFIRQARDEMIQTNHMPASAHEYALEDLVSANAPETSFYRPPKGRPTGEKLFFPGCQLVASKPDLVQKVYAHLNEAFDGQVGLMSACCGAPARWSGRTGLTGQVTSEFLGTWEKAGRPLVVLACPSCYLFFQNEIPSVKIESLWEVLAAKPPKGLELDDQTLELTLHDPCATRYQENVQQSVRSLMAKIAPNYKEQKYSQRLTKCCGYGGLGANANDQLGLEFAKDAALDGTNPLVSYCAMCRDRFALAGRPSLHLLDLLFAKAELGARSSQPGPNLTQKRDNRLSFKKAALAAFWDEVEPEPPSEPLEIVINEELWPKMERRRVLRGDIEQVIKNAALNGPLFYNQNTGRYLTSLRPRQVTFWVEYVLDEAGRYLIQDFWSHRMVAQGVPGAGAESPATLEGYARTGGRV